MMATETALLVADSLIGLDLPAAPQVIEPAVVFAASAEELRARLRRWERRFQNANAERTLKALRSDWQQFYGWCERAGAPCPGFHARPSALSRRHGHDGTTWRNDQAVPLLHS
jgi:hypothetical protein